MTFKNHCEIYGLPKENSVILFDTKFCLQRLVLLQLHHMQSHVILGSVSRPSAFGKLLFYTKEGKS